MTDHHPWNLGSVIELQTAPPQPTLRAKTRPSKLDAWRRHVIRLFNEKPAIDLRGACTVLNKRHPDLPRITKSSLHYRLRIWGLEQIKQGEFK